MLSYRIRYIGTDAVFWIYGLRKFSMGPRVRGDDVYKLYVMR